MTRPIESGEPRAAEREAEEPKRRLVAAWVILPAVIFAVVAVAFVLELAL